MMINRKVAVVMALAGCGDPDLFSLEGFGDLDVKSIDGAAASFQANGRDLAGVMVLGDIDGDGRDDMLFADYNYIDSPDHWLQSAYYLVYGAPDLHGRIDITNAPRLLFDADVQTPFQLDWFRALGDIDGDGLADFAVQDFHGTACDGQHKGAYIIYGSRARIAGPTRMADVGVSVKAPATCVGHHFDAAPLGDIDGDGIADFGFIDAAETDPQLDSKLYIFYGSHQRLAGTVDVTTADAVLVQTDDQQPRGVVRLGDIDGDGREDFSWDSLGAQTPQNFFEPPWEHRIVYGPPARFTGSSPIEMTRSTLIVGNQALGYISPLGDLDGDGLADLAISQCGLYDSAFDNGHTPFPGTEYLFYGRAGGLGESLDLTTADAAFPVAGGEFGSRMVAGDIDGDNIPDTVMTDINSLHANGAVYVMPGTGARMTSPVSLGATTTAYVGHPRSGVNEHLGWNMSSGDVDGDGRMDVLVQDNLTWDANDAESKSRVFMLSTPAP